jgi:hypothetical protein
VAEDAGAQVRMRLNDGGGGHVRRLRQTFPPPFWSRRL